ncbi:TOMM precursor leader peptide-binding protein [Nesterenkonia marinintestina]|uniref:TOMM precursor leader peptide-binding protein n=1 Tax=Nesterenkonia marinintestina TaxID=2979865 RepID=UPI0021BE72BB|nr:TOMM precursor leader peptide-binding protein [Nesterenkonia sp. GX14115]
MDSTLTRETETPTPDPTLRTYRLSQDVHVADVDAGTVRLRRGDSSVLLHGPVAESRAALEALRCGVPAAQAPETVRTLWRHRLVDLHPDLEHRARLSLARVRIDGLDEVGAHLADQLAGVGLGTLVLDDPHPVEAVGPDADLAGLGGTVHRGRNRAHAMREILTRRRPETPVFVSPPDGTASDIDVHVMCDPSAHRLADEDLVRFEEALGVASAVLPISRSDHGGGRIGPLLAPGRGPCTQCLELHVADQPRNPRTGPSTPETDVTGSPPEADGPPEDVVPWAGRGIVAAVAARQIHLLLAGHLRPAVADAMLSVDEQGRITEQPLGRHPGCTCVVSPQLRGPSPSEPPEASEPSPPEPSEPSPPSEPS